MGSTARIGDWIVTNSGHMFWPFDPRPEEVFVADIAWALSHKNRWGGHSDPWTVCQHSLAVSDLCGIHSDSLGLSEREHTLLELHGLLHDAHEAYLTDVPRPLKSYMAVVLCREGVQATADDMEPWDHVERVVDRAIYDHLGLDLPDERSAKIVKLMDSIMLSAESKLLFHGRARSVLDDTCVRFIPANEEERMRAQDAAMRIGCLSGIRPGVAMGMFLGRIKRLIAALPAPGAGRGSA